MNIESSYENTNRILLNTQMIADDIDDLQWSYNINACDQNPNFRGVELYSKGLELRDDIIYILKNGDGKKFPINKYAYITSEDIKGYAPHIRGINQDDINIINAILRIFERYHQFESSINEIVINDGSLNDLCLVGSEFFKNPMYIHDNMFTIIALPRYVEGMIQFEKSESGQNIHIPLWLINDFKYDEAYQETLKEKKATIWGIDQFPRNMRSLYVNLWDGDAYLGRLMINELESSLKSGQFKLAETFAGYIIKIMHRDMHRSNRNYRDYEDTIRTIVRCEQPNKSDLKDFLQIQGWKSNDEYLCIKLQSQNPEILIKSDSALRSLLTNLFPQGFDFFNEQMLCLIINLTNTKQSAEDIKTSLAAVVRDSLMYCGISNPTKGILSLGSAFSQSDYIIEYIKHNTTQWLLSFNECALSYITSSLTKNGSVENLIAPELITLINHDKEKGTEYYKTLRSYLKNERSIPRTSEDLIIHRTTLQYRLEKITELTKLNLDKEKQRLYILMSFIMLDGEN